jgi:hypothetical protein
MSTYSVGDGWEGSTFVALRRTSRAPSPTSSTSSSSSTSSQFIQKRRETFESKFHPIWKRFKSGTLSAQDKEFLESAEISLDDYDHYSSVFKFRRGVELVNSRIILIELPLRPHESCAETINHLMGRTYDLLPSGDICSLGSASTSFFFEVLTNRYALQQYQLQTTRLFLHSQKYASFKLAKLLLIHARYHSALSHLCC